MRGEGSSPAAPTGGTPYVVGGFAIAVWIPAVSLTVLAVVAALNL
ncbi:MAG: hypothetical protein V3U63_12800 [Gemmatimonadota bacterium]